MILATADLSPLPAWQAIAREAGRCGMHVDVTPEDPLGPGMLQAFLEDGGPARLWVISGDAWDLLAPVLAAYSDGGLGGRLLVINGPSTWLGRVPFPVFVPADEAAGVRLLGEALALSREFTTPVCLALPALSDQPVRQIGAARLAPVLSGLPAPPPQPEVAAARVVALANHAEGLGAWQLHRGGDRRLGLIAAGPVWHRARREHPEARCLRLDLAWPLPLKTIKGVVAVSQRTCWVPGGADWGAAALAEEGVTLAPWPPEDGEAREGKSPGKVG